MSSLSQFVKNGQNLSLIAGSAAINSGDLLEIGGPGNEAWSVATTDYAANAAAGTLIGQSSIVAASLAGASRAQLTRDRLGNIFHAGTNSGGNLVVYKFSPLASNSVSAIIDSTATVVATPKFFQLQNGTFACLYARASGALYFIIIDGALNVIVGPSSVATEYNSSNVVYHDAIALSGGGFAVAFQASAGTSVSLATYSNVGSVVQAATNVQSLASTVAPEFLRLGQLSSGNLICGYRGTMTAGGTAGTGFIIVTVAGAAIAGPINIDSTAVFGFLELSILAGYFALAEANGTNLKTSVYNNAGTLQGSQYSVADTLNSTTYPQVKLTNDGVQFWLAYFGSAANGLNVVQMPTTGATAGTSAVGLGSATLGASTYALDAEIINGLLVALAASSTTNGQYWLSVGLPDASLGITVPYLRAAPTTFGTAAATSGSNWPRIMSGGAGLYTGSTLPANQPTNPPTNGDFTAILAYDQQTTAATFIGVQKVEASAIIGLSNAAAIMAGEAGTVVTAVNPGPGDYPINAVAGTAGKAFNHTSFQPVGSFGTIYSTGVSLCPSQGGGVGLASGEITVVSSGFQPNGVFGSGKVAFLAASTVFSIPAPSIRVRVFGAGGPSGGTSSFGSYLSATGGTASVGGFGVGIGGNVINSNGGNISTTYGIGGGGAGTVFGNGGTATGVLAGSSGPSGAGGTGAPGTGSGAGGSGLFGIGGSGQVGGAGGVSGTFPPLSSMSLDLIGCGPGGSGSDTTAQSGGPGLNGGGAGGSGWANAVAMGGFPGGGGSSGSTGSGCGGGFAMSVLTGFTVGTTVSVTVGTSTYGGNGLVIVEY